MLGKSKYYYDTKRNMEYKKTKLNLDQYKGLDNHINNPEQTKPEKFDKIITIKVSDETFEAWELLLDNWGEVLGYDNKSKIFEFAVIEALNIPIASLGGFNH